MTGHLWWMTKNPHGLNSYKCFVLLGGVGRTYAPLLLLFCLLLP